MKVLKLILSLSLLLVKVDALEWSNWSTEKPIGNNVEIEQEDRYKWYIEYKEDKGYVLEDNNSCDLLDKKDKKIVTSYVPNLPSDISNKKYKPYNIEDGFDVNYFSGLSIFNLYSDISFDITEIELFDLSTNKNITYDFGPKMSYQSGSKLKLKDKNRNEKAMSSDIRNIIHLDFDYIYSNKDKILKIHYIDNGAKISHFYLNTYHGTSDSVVFDRVNDLSNLTTCNNGICIIEVPLKNYTSSSNYVTNRVIYQKDDIYYRCFNNNKFYLDGYYKDITGFKKDTKSKLTFYRYRDLPINKDDNSSDKQNTKNDKDKEPSLNDKKDDVSTDSNDEDVNIKDKDISINNKKDDIINNSSNLNSINKDIVYETREPERLTYKKIDKETSEIKEDKIDKTIAMNTNDVKKNIEKNNKHIYLIPVLCTSVFILGVILYYFKKKHDNLEELN